MNYFSKKKFFFIFAIISVLFIYSALNIKFTDTQDFKFHVFTVKFEYYGMDPVAIEKIITKPLEEKLCELDSIYEIKSTCRFNESVTSLWFYRSCNLDLTYLKIRKITEDLYNRLPGNVQTPQIYNSRSEDKSIICISMDWSKTILEKNVKPQLQSVAGVSEVIITGKDRQNIEITFDNNRIANYLITPSKIADSVSSFNTPNLITTQKSDKYISPFFIQNRINDREELSKIQVFSNENPVYLTSFSSVNSSVHKNTELELLNNTETAYINIKTSGNSNKISISDILLIDDNCVERRIAEENGILHYNPQLIMNK